MCSLRSRGRTMVLSAKLALRKNALRDDLCPGSDDMGEHEIQRLIAELFRPLLARFMAERGRLAHVGADQFIYWVEGKPGKRLAPDVYVLPGIDPNIAIRSWKVWGDRRRPLFRPQGRRRRHHQRLRGRSCAL